ncbi:hypothetical protein JXA40_00890 [bacterium]|nr:hypothetical protein [candidate division CSSED10-310 bacterium]
MNWKPLAIILIALSFTGCIWVDDDDDDYYWRDYVEHIIYINNTGYPIENFIDRHYVGTVDPWSELHVYDRDLEGYHLFYSDCVDCPLEWGPDEFYIHDGETFRIFLEADGAQSFKTQTL